MRPIDAYEANMKLVELYNQENNPAAKAALRAAMQVILNAPTTPSPPNAPLTLEELREMGQKCEAVYVAHTDGLPVFRDQKYCAAVLDFSPAFGSTVMHVHAIYGDRLTMWEDEYGKTWLAYRHKPENGGRE